MPLPRLSNLSGLAPLKPFGQGNVSPQEEQDLLSQLAGGAIGGLEYVGGALDKLGGRTVRSMVGGAGPEAFAHFIPFSDEMGLTDASKVPTGRELLERGNVLAPNTPGLDMGDVAGFGAEILMDPSTYATFGLSALSKAGSTAAKAGKLLPKMMGGARTAAEIGAAARAEGRLAPTIASRIHAGQGGLMGIAAPFSQEPFMLLGTGPTAAKFAENVLQPIGEGIKYALPSRHLRSLLDPTAGPVSTKEFQVAHEFAARPELEAALSEYRGQQYDLIKEVAGAGVSAAAKPEFDRIGMMAAESIGPVKAQRPSYGRWQMEMRAKGLDPNMLTQAQYDAAVKVGEGVAKIQKGMLDYANELGVPKQALEDEFASYLTRVKARYPDMDVGEAWRGFERGFEHGTASDIKRKFRDIPGGTDALNKIAMDKRFSGAMSPMTQKEAARLIRKEYLNLDHERNMAKLARAAYDVAKQNWEAAFIASRGRHATPAAQQAAQQALNNAQKSLNAAKSSYKEAAQRLQRIQKQGNQLAAWAKAMPEAYAGEGRNYFTTDVMESLGVSINRMAKVRSSAEAIHEIARRFSTASAGPNTVPLTEYLKRAGLTHNVGDAAIQAGAAPGGAKYTLAKRMGLSPDDLDNIHIPRELGDQVANYITLWTRPEEVKGLAKLYDSALALFKTSITQLFPAFHVRNLQDGVFRNWLTGAASLDSMADALSLMKGGPIRITPQMKAMGINTADDVIRAAYAHGVAWSPVSQNQIGDITGQAVKGGNPPVPGLAGQKTTGQALSDWWNKGAKDVRRPGAAGWLDWLDTSKDTNRVFAKASQVGNEVEDFVRVSHFLEKLRQGASPEVAAASVKATHFVYKDVTKFERAWMKRVMPFYVFARKNLPFAVKQLTEHPSRMSGSIRALNAGRDDEHFVPPWIGGEGTAIPLSGPLGEAIFGAPPAGQSRHLAGLGLGAVEEPFQRFHFGNDGLKRTAYDHLSMLTPALKAPLEALAGQQFMNGRDLQDLKASGVLSGYGLADAPVTGEGALTRAASQAIANSPLARFDSTMRKLTRQIKDDRRSDLTRAINVLTGANIVDVDDEKAKASIVREELKRRLDSSEAIESYEGYFVPKDRPLDAQGDEALLLQYWQQLRRDGRSRQR